MTGFALRWTILASALAFAPACSFSSLDGLQSGNASAGSGATAATSSATAGTGGGGGGGAGGGAGGAAGASSSSASTASAGGAGGGTPAGTVPCQGMECAANQVCCFSSTDPTQNHCGDSGTCGLTFVEIHCNGPEDCPGTICCGHYMNGAYDSVVCKAACTGLDEYTMCQGDPSVCPSGKNCSPSATLGPGYSLCQ